MCCSKKAEKVCLRLFSKSEILFEFVGFQFRVQFTPIPDYVNKNLLEMERKANNNMIDLLTVMADV